MVGDPTMAVAMLRYRWGLAGIVGFPGAVLLAAYAAALTVRVSACTGGIGVVKSMTSGRSSY